VLPLSLAAGPADLSAVALSTHDRPESAWSASTEGSGTILRGPLLWLGRLMWLAVLALVATIYLINVPDNLHATGGEWYISLTRSVVLPLMRWRTFMLYLVTWEYLASAIFILTGLFLFWRKSNDWLILFISATLLLLSLPFGLSSNMDALIYPRWLVRLWPDFGEFMLVLIISCFVLLFFLFPDGRIVPRWGRWVVGGVIIMAPLVDLPLLGINPDWRWEFFMSLYIAGMLIGLAGQVYHYRRISTSIQPGWIPCSRPNPWAAWRHCDASRWR
jgi:hypothetical protein